MDHRITIQRATLTANEYNEPIETWSDYITVWARRIDVTAGEAVRAAAVSASISAHFVIRYSPESATITPKDRISLEGGGVYDITGVRELKRNETLELHAVARADGT